MKRALYPSLLIIPVFIIVVTLGGCLHLRTVPEREFRLYSNAFDEVMKNTELLFEDYVAARELQATLAKRDKDVDATRLPEAFDPSSIKPIRDENKALSDRRAALQAVAQYNEIMLALAEGRSVRDVRDKLAKLEGLFDVISKSTLPFAGVFQTVFTEVMAAAEKARSRAEFVRAFREAGEGDEPVIPSILDFFIEDTRSYSEMKKVLVAESRKKITSRFGAQGRMMFSIAGMHNLPLTEKELYSKRIHLEYEYNKLFSQINPGAGFLYFPSEGHEPYTYEVHKQLENLMEPLKALANEEQRLVEELYNYNDGLRNYVELIHITKDYFTQVEDAICNASNKFSIYESIGELEIQMVRKAITNNTKLADTIDLIRNSYIRVSEEY